MHKTQFLEKCESYLDDLDVTTRNKILSNIIIEIDQNIEITKNSPLDLVNKFREQQSIQARASKKKTSFFKTFLKLGLVLLLVITIPLSILIWKFTPIMKIDEEKNQIIILGGLIDINGSTGKVKVFDQVQVTSKKYKDEFKVNIPMDVSKDEVIIQFDTISLNLYTSETSELEINCTLQSTPSKNLISDGLNTIEVDFSKVKGADCKIQVPRDKKLSIEGGSGQVTLRDPRFDFYAEIQNGNISFHPAEEEIYKYTLDVKNGFVDSFSSSKSKDAFEVNISIVNGAINLSER